MRGGGHRTKANEITMISQKIKFSTQFPRLLRVFGEAPIKVTVPVTPAFTSHLLLVIYLILADMAIIECPPQNFWFFFLVSLFSPRKLVFSKFQWMNHETL